MNLSVNSAKEVQWKNNPKCKKCDLEFENPYLWCPECNGLIEIEPIEVTTSQKEYSMRIARNPSIWNYHEFLPNFNHHISLCEGNTPLIELKNIKHLKGVLANSNLEILRVHLEIGHPP